MLNEAQREAVESKDPKILCLAGAGTGKTFSMISRILNLVDSGTPPRAILALTFTNAAALEMAVRYKKYHPEGESPEFKTFHAFCYSLIVYDPAVRSAIGYSQIPNVADEKEEKLIDKDAKFQSGCKLSASKLASSDLSQSELFAKVIYLKQKKKLMVQRNIITFNAMCEEVCALFKEDAPCIRRYKKQYQHVFVDEFQDTDPKQWEFVTTFKDAHLFLVGDALQALYVWRGADNSIIKALSRSKDWKVIRLHTNYRSTRQICKFANENSTYAESSYRIPIDATRDGEPVVLYETEKSYYRGCHELDIKYILSHLPELEGATAVLCRTNEEVRSAVDQLTAAGINCKSSDSKESVSQLIKALNDPEFEIMWLAAKMKSSYYSDFIRRRHFADNYDLEAFIKDFGPYVDEVSEGASLIDELRNAVELAKTDFFDGCMKILSLLSVKPNAKIASARTLDELFQHIEEAEESEAPAVYVGTIHSSKGLEYDNVFLMNVDGRSFPLTSEDNHNIYYVGITRAKNRLFVLGG